MTDPRPNQPSPQPGPADLNSGDMPTILASNGDTQADFEAALASVKSLPNDTEMVKQCQDLTNRLRNIDEVRRLAAQLPDGSETTSDVPEKLGQFELLECLGSGGMGRVYKARHQRLNKIQAIKLLHIHRAGDPEAVSRFQQEMRAIGQMQHPNIVSAQHADEADGVPYLVMDFVEGRSLSHLTREYREQGRNIPVGMACEIVRQAAIGLQYAHEKGVIHRDIKPGNIMLDVHGVVRVLDLGLARISPQNEDDRNHESLTSDFQVLGTPDYMAPEQLRSSRNVDARCDIYALGATLFYLLTGQVCFPADKDTPLMDKAVRILSDPPPDVSALRSDLPAELADLVNRCLAKDPAGRPESAGKLAETLGNWASRTAIQLSSEGSTTEFDSRTLANRATAGAGDHSMHRRLMIAAGLLLPILFFAGVIYRLKLPDGGELVVELTDPSANLTVIAVKGDETKELEFAQEESSTFRLTKGPWSLRLSGLDADRFELTESSVTILDGQQKLVSIKVRNPSEDAVALKDPPVEPALPEPSQGPGEPAAAIEHPSAETSAAAIDWTPQDASTDLSGIVLQPAKLSPHFQVGTHLLCSPVGINDHWNHLRHHFDVDVTGKRWLYLTGKEVLLRDIATNETLAMAVGGTSVHWVSTAFSPDGSLFAVLDANINKSRGLEIRDITGRLISQWQYSEPFHELPEWRPCQVQWMSNNQQILLWNHGAAIVFDLQGNVVHKVLFANSAFNAPPEWHGLNFPAPASPPGTWTVSVHPDGGEVTFVLGVGRIVRWNLTDNQLSEIDQFKPSSHEDYGGLKWSRQGDKLLVWCGAQEGTEEPTARIYSRTGELLHSEPRIHWGLADWSPDGLSIVTDSGAILDDKLQFVKQLPVTDQEGEIYPHASRIPYWKAPLEVVFTYAHNGRIDHSGMIRRFRLSGSELETRQSVQPLNVRAASHTYDGKPSSVHTIGDGQVELFCWDGAGRRANSVLKTPMYINATGISWSRTEPVIAVQDHFCQRIVDYSNGENNVWDYDNAIEDRLAPVFSPDGQSVAFADVRSDRFVIQSREGQILHEFEGGEYHSFPHWSPDGRWIVWKSLKGENVRLNIVDLSAASPVPVTIPLTLHFLFAVTISPDSRFVAYIDHTDNERRAERLHVYELSTGQQNHSEITWNRHFGFAPVWSQDSSQIYAGQLFSVGQNSELKLVRDLNRASYVQFAEFTSAGRILLGGAEFTKGDPFAFHLLEATGAELATKVISTRINPLLQPPCARIRRHEDHAIVIAQHDMLGLGHSLAMLNVETGELQWNGIAFSDGQTLALTPGGDILHGPEDIDRYIVQSIRYPGGRTVPATRKQLLERLSETDQQAAVRWATDHGARMVTEDGAESDPEGTSQPASTALPKAASISELDFSGSKELVQEELAHLAAFENLSVLDLSSTNLPELPPLDTLKHLTDLNLSHSTVTSIAGVRECVSLLALNLSHTPIDPVAVESIRELKNLTRLNLNHTRIDRFALAELASLHSLKELHLEGVEVPTENINHLKMALPDCRIIISENPSRP